MSDDYVSLEHQRQLREGFLPDYFSIYESDSADGDQNSEPLMAFETPL